MAGEAKAEVDGTVEAFSKGVQIVAELLHSHGFKFVAGRSGKSSGGPFANGDFVKNNRTIHLSLRGSLGLVIYTIAGHSMDHESYMRQLGVSDKSLYPTFSPDVQEQFRCLASDVSHYCSDFVSGTGGHFVMLAEDLERHPNKYKGLPE